MNHRSQWKRIWKDTFGLTNIVTIIILLLLVIAALLIFRPYLIRLAQKIAETFEWLKRRVAIAAP